MTEHADPQAKGWYYRKQGKPHGPVARERLQAMIESRELLADAEVWHPSLVGWQVAALHFKMPRPKPPPQPELQAAPKPRDLARYDLGRDLDQPGSGMRDADANSGSRYGGDFHGSGGRGWIGLGVVLLVLPLLWLGLRPSTPKPEPDETAPPPRLILQRQPAIVQEQPLTPVPVRAHHPAPSAELSALLRLLSEQEPVLHAELHAALFPEPGPDGRVPPPIDEAEARLRAVAELARRASDDVALRWLDARLEQLRFLRDDRLFSDCLTLLSGQQRVNAVHPSLQQREQQAIELMLADARGRQPWRVDPAQADRDHAELRGLAAQFRAERFGDIEQPTEAELQQFDCRTATEYHDRWLRMPTARAANLLRARGPLPDHPAARP